MSDISLDDRYTVPGRHWHPPDDGRVQCDVCRARSTPTSRCATSRPAHGHPAAGPGDRTAARAAVRLRRQRPRHRGRPSPLPGCGAAVVERGWYRIDHYRLTDDGRCTVLRSA